MVLNQRQEEIQRKKMEAEAVKENLEAQLSIVDKKKEELEHMQRQEIEKLEAISGLSAEEAKERMVDLVMGTRCGQVDASAITFIGEKEGMSYAELNTMMNKKSGVQGLTDISSDMRDIDRAYVFTARPSGRPLFPSSSRFHIL